MLEGTLDPRRLAPEIGKLIASLQFPPSNDPLADSIRDIFIEQTVSSVAKRFSKASDAIKDAYPTKLATPCEAFTIAATSNVTITAKVNKPRETFDKDEFIRQVSELYELNPLDLHNIADKTVKLSKPPVSLTAIYGDISE